MSWHAERFEQKEGRLRFDCVACGRAMWFPQSKAGKYKTCSDVCANRVRAEATESRKRSCATCGESFVPRTTQLAVGGGKYCSVRCAEPTRVAGRTREVAVARGRMHSEACKAGKWKPLLAEANPRWRGGRDAYLRRQAAKDPEHRRASRRLYLKNNAERAREWRQKRRGLGALPRGTVRRIGQGQRWRCAVCRADIRPGYHIDHVMPLALGGQHKPSNLQLLCATCNLQKSAKHPVDFMRQKGFLL